MLSSVSSCDPCCYCQKSASELLPLNLKYIVLRHAAWIRTALP
ncbi:hypothetical protein GCWU000341_01560 [Oribacterium sp. oral taxon 078 str. F0262]|nr:hypothetical protein GCWU000341_01560 [Oribacterium sp. oral taxon 078 str. F0262]